MNTLSGPIYSKMVTLKKTFICPGGKMSMHVSLIFCLIFRIFSKWVGETICILNNTMVKYSLKVIIEIYEYINDWQVIWEMRKEDTRQMERTLSVNSPVLRQNKGELLNMYVKNHSHQIPFCRLYLSIPSCFPY